MGCKRIPLGPDYHAEPGETKGHQHDVYTTKGEPHGYTRIYVGTLMKSAVEDLAQMEQCRSTLDARRADYAEGRRQHWQNEAERLALMVRELGGDPERK